LALNRGPRAKVTDFRYGFRKIKALKLVSVGAGNYFFSQDQTFTGGSAIPFNLFSYFAGLSLFLSSSTHT
jgi:hypothetical protein